jgi:hypothetical protein
MVGSCHKELGSIKSKSKIAASILCVLIILSLGIYDVEVLQSALQYVHLSNGITPSFEASCIQNRVAEGLHLNLPELTCYKLEGGLLIQANDFQNLTCGDILSLEKNITLLSETEISQISQQLFTGKHE